MPFPWASGFSAAQQPTAYSLDVERACVLFTIAAYYADAGHVEPRADSDSLRRATSSFQTAAGCLWHIEQSLGSALAAQNSPPELRPPALSTLRYLMLAQAQECYWQKARQGV